MGTGNMGSTLLPELEGPWLCEQSNQGSHGIRGGGANERVFFLCGFHCQSNLFQIIHFLTNAFCLHLFLAPIHCLWWGLLQSSSVAVALMLLKHNIERLCTGPFGGSLWQPSFPFPRGPEQAPSWEMQNGGCQKITIEESSAAPVQCLKKKNRWEKVVSLLCYKQAPPLYKSQQRSWMKWMVPMPFIPFATSQLSFHISLKRSEEPNLAQSLNSIIHSAIVFFHNLVSFWWGGARCYVGHWCYVALSHRKSYSVPFLASKRSY